MDDELKEPLKPDDAKQLIRTILQTGRFTYTRHAMALPSGNEAEWPS